MGLYGNPKVGRSNPSDMVLRHNYEKSLVYWYRLSPFESLSVHNSLSISFIPTLIRNVTSSFWNLSVHGVTPGEYRDRTTLSLLTEVTRVLGFCSDLRTSFIRPPPPTHPIVYIFSMGDPSHGTQQQFGKDTKICGIGHREFEEARGCVLT